MENILIEKQDSIAVVTINRPTKLNALNKATIQELHDGFKALNDDKSVKAIIITGSGEKSVCSWSRYFRICQFFSRRRRKISCRRTKIVV